jgi:hypothetical protein
MRPAGADEHDDAVTRLARQAVAVAPVGVPVYARPDAVCVSISREGVISTDWCRLTSLEISSHPLSSFKKSLAQSDVK